ncbi:E3 ubiquitin-protein ligase TRIM38-like [Suncus etruscus]|uniref:E3 ubiquitin-protein ligase TRIM38-like n=1 Tax=Suncus etruscus TaxID=109475 RepID=UPI00211068FE|nr:E3 ubiquitin-protein ligase TRIM38-like [Suncus etruscus]
MVSLVLPSLCKVSKFSLSMKTILKTCYVSVTLDPDTAHYELTLTENQRQVTHGSPSKKSKTPKRFSVSPCMLGCETFTSGRHFFEVNVYQSTDWDVGVCLENVPRDSQIILGPIYGFWAISRRKSLGYFVNSISLVPLDQEKVSWHVGVFLDCESRQVSFYNMNTSSCIFTFKNASFSGVLKPYFWVCKGSILCLPPLEK